MSVDARPLSGNVQRTCRSTRVGPFGISCSTVTGTCSVLAALLRGFISRRITAFDSLLDRINLKIIGKI